MFILIRKMKLLVDSPKHSTKALNVLGLSLNQENRSLDRLWR